MDERTIKLFAKSLEKAGFCEGGIAWRILPFVNREIVPIADKEKCSLFEAAEKCIAANPEKSNNTGYMHYALKVALKEIDGKTLKIKRVKHRKKPLKK